jgi:regulator of sirC expression with transglutaminase-like and TPR domain
MIRNLIGQMNESRNSAPEMLPYLDLVVALDPEPNSERLTRALLREKLGDRRGARTDVLWLIEHLPGSVTEEQRETLHQWLERLSR